MLAIINTRGAKNNEQLGRQRLPPLPLISEHCLPAIDSCRWLKDVGRREPRTKPKNAKGGKAANEQLAISNEQWKMFGERCRMKEQRHYGAITKSVRIKPLTRFFRLCGRRLCAAYGTRLVPR
jgi:hypothetical protein